jgi:hypothetical protein
MLVPRIRRLIALHVLGERLGNTRNELAHHINREDPGNQAMHLLLQDVRDWTLAEIDDEWQQVCQALPKGETHSTFRHTPDKSNHPENRRYTDG